MTTVHHFRWDVDKTYLQTDFDGTRALLRTFFQKANEKVTVPAATTLLRELLSLRTDNIARKVMFISGSPRQMRNVLTEKLRLDGISPDRFILKPNLSNVLLFRFKSVRSQVGYKLSALLRSMIHKGDVSEILFGDDSEQDAFIYSLYSALLQNQISLDILNKILLKAGVAARDRMTILEYAAMLPSSLDGRKHSVRRIYIHLDRRSPTVRFSPFGTLVVPIYNYFQVALVMFWDAQLESRSLLRVIEAIARSGYSATRLANSVQNLIHRGYGKTKNVTCLMRTLSKAPSILPSDPTPIIAQLADLLLVMPIYTTKIPVPDLDYLVLASDHKYVPQKVNFPILSFLNT